MRFLKSLAPALTIVMLSGAAAQAQAIRDSETATDYDTIGKWKLTAITEGGEVTGCRGRKKDPGQKARIILQVDPEGTPALIVPAFKPQGATANGVFSVDNRRYDVSFDLVEKKAIHILTEDESDAIRAGKSLSTSFAGQKKTRTWSLSGASAVLDTLETCAIMGGS